MKHYLRQSKYLVKPDRFSLHLPQSHAEAPLFLKCRLQTSRLFQLAQVNVGGVDSHISEHRN